VDHQVGRLRKAVEVQREVVRREDLAERDRGRQAVHRRHEAIVHTEPAQRVVQEGTERVVPGPADHGGAPAVAGGGHGDVGRAAAEELGEGPHLTQRDAGLLWIQVYA
jgi:hypothetical protein